MGFVRVRVVILLAALCCGAAPPEPPPAPTGAVAPIDRVLATVDGTPVWWSAYQQALATQPPPTTDAERAEQAKRELAHQIETILIAHRAAALRLEVTEAEVDEGLKQIMKQNNLDPAGLVAALAQMGWSLPQYRISIRSQILDLRAFHDWLSARPAGDSAPDKLAAMHDVWVGELRATARIEVR